MSSRRPARHRCRLADSHHMHGARDHAGSASARPARHRAHETEPMSTAGHRLLVAHANTAHHTLSPIAPCPVPVSLPP